MSRHLWLCFWYTKSYGYSPTLASGKCIWIDGNRICELWYVCKQMWEEKYKYCDMYAKKCENGNYARTWLKRSGNYSGITYTFKGVICPSISHPFDYLQTWKNSILKSLFCISFSLNGTWFVKHIAFRLCIWKQCAVLSLNDIALREYFYDKLFWLDYIGSS